MVMNESLAVMDGCKITRDRYESPSVKLLFFQSEGVLCQSVGGGNQDFTYDDAEDL